MKRVEVLLAVVAVLLLANLVWRPVEVKAGGGKTVYVQKLKKGEGTVEVQGETVVGFSCVVKGPVASDSECFVASR
jgi:hypothetical protein